MNNVENILKEIEKLTDEEKLLLIDKCSIDNNQILYMSFYTKDTMIEEILYLNEDDFNEDEITDWLTNTNGNIVFDLIQKHSDKERLSDLENYNRFYESLLTYIEFDFDEFLKEMKAIILEDKRDKVIDLFILKNEDHSQK
ncbi:MAG: hypothetical protein ACOYLP_02745 [Flavobacterium sp.]|uniref:hypothetical protein n=1 Tax=Flavobacterium sp. TaxID=239 RepID=UPI003BC502CC